MGDQQMEQEGGRILGEGVYGCAFDPPLKCSKKKKVLLKGHSVGKVSSVSLGTKELSVSQYLKDIPNADKYYVLIEDMCTPAPRVEQTEPDLKKCEYTSGIALPKTAQVIMPYGGTALRMVPKTTKRIDFFRLGQHLLEAGTLLLTKKVVHRDIHPMNVLLSSPSDARLIDFGLAWRPDAIAMNNLRYLLMEFIPRFIQEPPELSYINGIDSKISEPLVLSRIVDEKLILHLIQRVYGISKEEQRARLFKFVHSSKSIEERNWFSYFKLYWSKIDAWAIGANLLTLYVDLTFDPEFEKSRDYSEKKYKCLNAIRHLCDLDAAKRYDAAEALAEWAPDSPVLQRKEVKDWLAEQRAVRKELI